MASTPVADHPRRRFWHPSRVVVLAFVATISIGTALLSLPWATADGGRTAVVDALFTATSAVCVTGLVVVDTGTHWSTFGQVVVLALVQIGGLGIMVAATLIGLAVTQRISLVGRLRARTEAGIVRIGDVRRIVLAVLGFTVAFELVGAVLIGGRLWVTYDYGAARAVAHGVFHSVSAFNNAGFALHGDNLERFVGDPMMHLFITVGFIAGGLGFPVLAELVRRHRFRRWSLHAQLTLGASAFLLVVGFVVVTAIEWGNSETLGPLGVVDKLFAGGLHGATPRTAGFNSIDIGAMREPSLLLTQALMFVGGGSASTAGGIKVTTAAVLVLVAWSELRGEREVAVRGRRLPEGLQREAVTIALVALAAVGTATILLVGLTPLPTSSVMFEAFSAFGTVGLSTGITSDLTDAGKVLLALTMLLGRVGPLTLGTAVVLRRHERRYRRPEGELLVG